MSDDSSISVESILFPGNRTAQAIRLSEFQKAESIAERLALKPYKAVILILGGTCQIEESLIPRLTQLFVRGIARAASEAGALIIDSGGQGGVSALMGKGVASRGIESNLIAVAPANKLIFPESQTGEIAAEPNHSSFLLVKGDDWGCETTTLFDLAGVLAGSSISGRLDSQEKKLGVPVLAILANGGQVSINEVLNTVRKNLPLIVVEGSGGMADQIAAAWKQKDSLPEDPDMAEIIADGNIQVHSLDHPVNAIQRLVQREIGGDQVLMQAWETFADYDSNANSQQKKSRNMQLWILGVGVLATALAIIQTMGPKPDAAGPHHDIWKLIFYLLLSLPIVLTMLVTASNRFKEGNKWLLLRAGAESIKREIYRYRTRALNYNKEPEHELSKKIEEITRRTMRTEVNSTALVRYDKSKGFPPLYLNKAQGGDDGFSFLTPDRYLKFRLADQLMFFREKSVRLEWEIKLLYWLTFGIGGLGTYLAAIDEQAWIALTTALVAAIGTYLSYNQTESTLTKYNQAATDLENINLWWNALSPNAQSEKVNIDSLVEHTEQVLQSELDGWVQQMRDALSSLRKEPMDGKGDAKDDAGDVSKGDANDDAGDVATEKEKDTELRPDLQEVSAK
ncbi:MAG: hypothetical protein DM484_20405 [Candidatus Methylumidiphilus alinenensis]|uniref:SMODS and SLOG-associating 2TM effector domain-containing protein n=1 Tax=Candidatus Methylumidiphilus alinenensis TaxID=2202197 RepID=A0A2W4QUM6_9GAMM|nr:MAG: hypothetical protein DM484_20405 [Candidatus Methylumidiphilus alinenensis]